jgi:DNA repair protein RadD
MLRPYQRQTLDALYDWFYKNPSGNPCVVLPTGAGKSHVIASLCEEALAFPDQRILMLTHQKELIEQDVEKLLIHYPSAPVGIYSASIGKKEIAPITFAGIQSIRGKASILGSLSLIIIDECHLVSHKEEGTYRTLIQELVQINPALRVVGFTATPWRLGHGLITDGSALFDAIIQTSSISDLQSQGYLCPLRSKTTVEKLCTDGVHMRGGEFIESELQKAVNIHTTTESVVKEVIEKAKDRNHWLIFCTGVEHARDTCRVLNEQGIISDCVTGETPKNEREQILSSYRNGKIQAITNANVLTTGFDFPGIDLIVMMRPTMSPVLYMQMAGRGLRIQDGKKDCLVLDFAGNVALHGPVDHVQPPKAKKEGEGVAPSKICPQCDEIVYASARICPSCGYEFPKKEKIWILGHADIQETKAVQMPVFLWHWKEHIGRESGKPMLLVSYMKSLVSEPIDEYLTINHDGYAGDRAIGILNSICKEREIDLQSVPDMPTLVMALNAKRPPSAITYKRQGKYKRVISRIW